jgi:4-amino-4-deoxy-L-arabinose transferase-like glycosyltransferase
MDDVKSSRRPVPRLGLVAVLAVAAALRLWRLSQNGFGNEYYTAGVRSMSQSWHNFLYNSFDPGGFISVDKPPVALWAQVASVKLFGFHPLSVLIPQALEGVAAVAILYHLVARRFGAAAGLLAALFLALTPASVAIDRSSNTDSCLVLVLLLAAWALTLAVERGSLPCLVLAMALVGFGFNVKMLAAFVVLPTFALVYLVGAPVGWWRRVGDLAIAGVVLVVVSSSWMVAYDLTPADRRPYAGTSDRNSMLELVVGPYGMGRFVRAPEFRSAAMASANPPAGRSATQAAAGATSQLESGPRRGFSRLFVRAPAGPLRLADGQLAGQVGWLLPFAIAGLALVVLRERLRGPLSPTRLAALLWLGWLVTYAVVYSYAGGFFHFYYLATMAPPLAALAGIGFVRLSELSLRGGARALFLPACLLLTSMWQLYIDTNAMGWRLDGYHSLHVALTGGTLLAAAALLVIFVSRPSGAPQPMGPSGRVMSTGAAAVGLAAALVAPSAWALSSVLVPGAGSIPSADLGRLLPVAGDTLQRTRSVEPYDPSGLVAFLEANHAGERYLLATTTTRLAAPIIIASGQPVMAMGGFHGLDPILTPDKLARMVDAGQIRFVMVGDASFISRQLGADVAAQPIAEWVQEKGQLVDPALWRSSALGGRRSGMRLYDLRPGPLAAVNP